MSIRKHIAQVYILARGIGDFDTYIGCTWNRSKDTHFFCSKGKRYIVFEIANLVDALALPHLDTKGGNQRSRHIIYNATMKTKFLQGKLEALLGLFQFLRRRSTLGTFWIRT